MSNINHISKDLFEFDMFWSIQDISILQDDKIIAIYCTTPTTHNILVLIDLFGKEKVNQILETYIKFEHNEAYKICKRIINDPKCPQIIAKNKAPFDF